jgi:hypothetical protein
MSFVRNTSVAAVAAAGVLAVASADIALRAAGSQTLSVPGRASANVSIAADGSFAVLVWAASAADGATDIYAATSHDSGATLSAPVRVNATPGDARANGEQPPRVALISRVSGAPEIAVVWLSRRQAGTVLLTSRSTDGGRTFKPAIVVAGSEAAGNRGWEAIGADRKGSAYVTWLDHRRLAERDTQMAAMHHHDHGSTAPTTATKPDGVAMAELSQVYFAKLDGSEPHAVTGGVCYCCKTAVATGSAGEIYLAWRHVYPGNLRDIAFTASHDGGRTFSSPVRVSEDEWAIEGCPEDGPSLAVDRSGRVHVVWPTVVTENNEPVKALFHAVSGDGRKFGARTRIPTHGQATHPQLAFTGDGALAVAWDESGNGARRIAFARGTVAADGRVTFQPLRSSQTAQGTYPVLAAVERGLLASWTSGDPARSVIRVEGIQ